MPAIGVHLAMSQSGKASLVSYPTEMHSHSTALRLSQAQLCNITGRATAFRM